MVHELGLQAPATHIAAEIYSLHNLMMIICLVIFVAVFGVMFYSIIKHRKSAGHKPHEFHENTIVEVIWTIIPFVIVIGMTIPAARTVLAQKDTRNADLTVKVTGYQWKWGYEYINDGVQFVSTLTTPRGQIDNYNTQGDAKTQTYLLDVDNPLVVPVGKKVRLLITANDVIHAWALPQFGVKQDAIPGFIRDTWFEAKEPGIYRGQCSELCGKDHGFMPIVVKVLPQADYDTWLADAKKKAAAAKDDPNKVWTKDEIVARGKTVYEQNCVACHQAGGTGVPGTFPALKGSKIATGPKADHIHIVLNGKNAMPKWASLSDTEIAAVISYERNSWGNDAGIVQPSEVKAGR